MVSMLSERVSSLYVSLSLCLGGLLDCGFRDGLGEEDSLVTHAVDLHADDHGTISVLGVTWNT